MPPMEETGFEITLSTGPKTLLMPVLTAEYDFTTKGAFVKERNDTTRTRMAMIIAIEFLKLPLF